jgi:hypothetical protein
MNPRLLIATILLLIRAGLTGMSGLGLLAFAGFFWISRPASPSAGYGITLFIVLGLVAVGVPAVAIAVPSILFAVLLLTRKWWPTLAVLIGESLVAIVLVAAMVWALTQGGDRSIQFVAIVSVATLALVSFPVIVLLAWNLSKQRL